LLGKTRKLVSNQMTAVLQQLKALGWLVNAKTSHLTPTCRIEHLGYVLDTGLMTTSLSGKKIHSLQKSIQ
ncbi:hypothetical protein F4703DRAFT_1718127, partial [Phycomyces blakesleeanus]